MNQGGQEGGSFSGSASESGRYSQLVNMKLRAREWGGTHLGALLEVD